MVTMSHIAKMTFNGPSMCYQNTGIVQWYRFVVINIDYIRTVPAPCFYNTSSIRKYGTRHILPCS